MEEGLDAAEVLDVACGVVEVPGAAACGAAGRAGARAARAARAPRPPAHAAGGAAPRPALSCAARWGPAHLDHRQRNLCNILV